MLTDCSDQSTQSATFHHPMPVEIISVVWDGTGNTEISNHCLHWYKRMNGSVLFSTEPSVASASWWICLSWAYVVFPVQHPPHPDVGSSAASLPILTVLNLPSVIFIWACWTFVSIITVSLLGLTAVTIAALLTQLRNFGIVPANESAMALHTLET